MIQTESEIINKRKTEFSDTRDLLPLAEKFKDKKVVMLGEASHGTHQYYNRRARLTRILMSEYDFNFMAVEGDWPTCYELNRHVKNYSDAEEKTFDVLQQFDRWPVWMWANWEIYEWAQWLREFNEGKPSNRRKGFYGLDVYSLWESLEAIMDYLKGRDPSALETAREAIRCFEPHRGGDGQKYALSTRIVPEGCEKEVTKLLTEIVSKAPAYNSDREHVFSTKQNAITAKNAEEYYRKMVTGDSTWNLRDKHMMNTLDRLLEFHGEDSKGIVWAHNTHIGDASYTDMADSGMFNIGELARKRHGRENVALIGFGSYQGSVLAGDAWGEPVKVMNLPAGKEGSFEAMCHEAGDQFFIFSDDLRKSDFFEKAIPHRAVGVVYHPEREQYGNYVPSIIPNRYDAFIFFDRSDALNAIPVGAEKKKLPETYPFGL